MRCMYSKQLLAKKKKFSDGFLKVSSQGVGVTRFVSLFAANSRGDSPHGDPLDEGYIRSDLIGEEDFVIER